MTKNSESRIDRRGFLKGAAAVGAGSAIAVKTGESWAASPLQDVRGTHTVVTIVSIQGPRVATVAKPGGAALTLALEPAADVFRDAPCDLAAFTPGERVVATGDIVGGTIRATAVSPLLRSVSAHVQSSSGSVLRTTAGEIAVTPHTVLTTDAGGSISVSDLSGRAVAGLVRDEPSGRVVATMVAPVVAHQRVSGPAR